MISRRRRFTGAALTVAWRQLHNLFRNPALLLPPLIMPIFFFVAFAGGLSAVDNAPGFDYPDYDSFQFVFVLLQSAAFGGVFTGIGIAADFEFGFARRLMLATRDRTALIAGYALVALARAALVMAVLVVVALIGGASITGSGIDLFGLFGLALIFNVAFTLLAAGIAFRVRSLQGAPLMQVPVFILLLTAPVYVPLDLVEGWVHAVAQVNPVTAVLQSGRGLVIGDPVEVGLAFAVVAGLVAVFSVWAVRGMRRAEAAG
ncbi:MAG TPA: ABC transporter permease [Solirubrobacterales bacterium]|nr:ABC transporter permease [Solirubrobacterales bacterium]